jgi:hypothetical protein
MTRKEQKAMADKVDQVIIEYFEALGARIPQQLEPKKKGGKKKDATNRTRTES